MRVGFRAFFRHKGRRERGAGKHGRFELPFYRFHDPRRLSLPYKRQPRYAGCVRRKFPAYPLRRNVRREQGVRFVLRARAERGAEKGQGRKGFMRMPVLDENGVFRPREIGQEHRKKIRRYVYAVANRKTRVEGREKEEKGRIRVRVQGKIPGVFGQGFAPPLGYARLVSTTKIVIKNASFRCVFLFLCEIY